MKIKNILKFSLFKALPGWLVFFSRNIAATAYPAPTSPSVCGYSGAGVWECDPPFMVISQQEMNDTIKNATDPLYTEINSLLLNQSDYQTAQQTIVSLNNTVTQLGDQLKLSHDENQANQQVISSLNNTVTQFGDQLKLSHDQNQVNQQTISSLNNKINDLNASNNKDEQKIQSLTDELQKKDTQLTSQSQDLASLKNSINSNSKLIDPTDLLSNPAASAAAVNLLNQSLFNLFIAGGSLVFLSLFRFLGKPWFEFSKEGLVIRLSSREAKKTLYSINKILNEIGSLFYCSILPLIKATGQDTNINELISTYLQPAVVSGLSYLIEKEPYLKRKLLSMSPDVEKTVEKLTRVLHGVLVLLFSVPITYGIKRLEDNTPDIGAEFLGNAVFLFLKTMGTDVIFSEIFHFIYEDCFKYKAKATIGLKMGEKIYYGTEEQLIQKIRGMVKLLGDEQTGYRVTFESNDKLKSLPLSVHLRNTRTIERGKDEKDLNHPDGFELSISNDGFFLSKNSKPDNKLSCTIDPSTLNLLRGLKLSYQVNDIVMSQDQVFPKLLDSKTITNKAHFFSDSTQNKFPEFEDFILSVQEKAKKERHSKQAIDYPTTISVDNCESKPSKSCLGALSGFFCSKKKRVESVYRRGKKSTNNDNLGKVNETDNNLDKVNDTEQAIIIPQ